MKTIISEGKFRQDLYYRINVVNINIPPLCERPEDIPLLVDHFIARFSSLKGKAIEGISSDALGIHFGHHFPGNVRELENIIEHAFVMCLGGMIQVRYLPEHYQWRTISSRKDGNDLVGQFERDLIIEVLRRNRWNRLEAAKELGIHKTTLFRKIKKLGIPLPGKDGRSSE